MSRRCRAARRLAGTLGLLLGLAACQERLTAPADCPALCPGGQAPIYDTVLTARIGLDSSYTGYVLPTVSQALLVSSGLRASEDRAVVRFTPRPDSVLVQDTLRPYTVDSVALALGVVARDTAVHGLTVHLHRLPTGVDSATTFAAVDAELTEATLVASIPVPDTLVTGAIRAVLTEDVVADTASGVLALGVRITAEGPTGVRLGSLASGSNAPTFTTFVTALGVADTARRRQSILRGVAFNSFVSQGTPTAGPDLLPVGGEPSSRALVRFDLPERIRDSMAIIRATLELTPVDTLFGLPNDPARLDVRAVLADLGAKSPVTVDPQFTASAAVAHGTVGPVQVEVLDPVRVWLGDPDRPTAFFLSLREEAASFIRPVFHSTRSAGAEAAALAPRLRISYVPQFPFESP